MTADPYPTDLFDEGDPRDHIRAEGEVSISPGERELIRVLTRIAIALERGSQPVQNAPQRPPAALQALPPVQNQPGRPACPYHGADKVAPSTNGKGGFYCQAKGGPDVNAKGYCRWHT